ncbi:His-Xaa-Ser system radical SAM maturase HxsB [Desulfomonile tiedjei]|uniref:His-Xaa-Ser repeat-associated upstream radical SAM protein n=1 Tax=Desulfomonile tiedjei (strain ATCC 49306 / DSM 6799 / DCB-1) TaxID=706587 RepID=I4CDT5_DESTA|nr:His-Xaa-Ser system radical SAM maturase HxsB [Desulfomonile tiedjei]AFM27726.1 His-Xaa-Ser repeat-associated upstream radical SAM protein [Desulfomonile tiedjei DSM 6799]
MQGENKPYFIFPFHFERHREQGKCLLVNLVGEFIFLSDDHFVKMVEYDLDSTSPEFTNLKAKHFLTDTDIAPIVNLLAIKYRTKKAYLDDYTALHMVVVTLRCNHRCNYCHASSQSANQYNWDMHPETALNVVRTIMDTPSKSVKIEFQGGEPVLNFKTIQIIVEEAEKLNIRKKKLLSFVLCTNMSLLTKSHFRYLKKHGVMISTSLDGPQHIHDLHRTMRDGNSSYNIFKQKLEDARLVMGNQKISALMTTTKDSLPNLEQIIDEYVSQGFHGIFLRSLNPFGYARSSKNRSRLDYPIDDFIEAYKKALLYIIDLNLKGVFFPEYFATLLLKRILTPFSTGFVDLQSPSGAGISGVIYNFDGDVYPTDEARMLAAMGEKRFCMGNVNRSSFAQIFSGTVIDELVNKSCVETLPGCHSCAIQTYCGCDPVRNFAEQGDPVGHRPTSDFCKKNYSIIYFLLGLIEQNNDKIMDVLWSWITDRPLNSCGGNSCERV